MKTRVCEIRCKKEMTTVELARKSGVSRTTIWMIESGNAKNVCLVTLQKIAAALDTTVEKLLEK